MDALSRSVGKFPSGHWTIMIYKYYLRAQVLHMRMTQNVMKKKIVLLKVELRKKQMIIETLRAEIAKIREQTVESIKPTPRVVPYYRKLTSHLINKSEKLRAEN